MRRILTVFFTIIACVALRAQMNAFRGAPSAARWSSRVEMTGAKSGKIVLTMTPSKGWHIYGFEVGEGGPKAMKMDFGKSTGIKFKGDVKPSDAPEKVFDDMFGIDVTYWGHEVVFTREFEVVDRTNAKISGVVNYQGCNDSSCSAPQTYNVSLSIPAANAK